MYGNPYTFDTLPCLPSSSTLTAWTNQFFQHFPVSHVFQAITVPRCPPHSPVSSPEQWDAVLHPVQPSGGRNGDFPIPTSGMTTGISQLAPSPSWTASCCLATCPDLPCSAAASSALPHGIIIHLSPLSKCVPCTPRIEFRFIDLGPFLPFVKTALISSSPKCLQSVLPHLEVPTDSTVCFLSHYPLR